MKKILSLFFVTFSLSCFACQDINFYDNHPRINQLKIVNQGDMHTCYAHSLASIYNLDKAQNLSEEVHPYWVAFMHKQRYLHWSPKNLNYSILSWAYSDLKKIGNCNPSIINEKLTQLKNGVNYSDDQLMYLLKEFFKNKKFKKIRLDSVFYKEINKTFLELRRKSSKFERPWLKGEIEKVLIPLRSYIYGLNFMKFLNHYVFKDCFEHNTSVNEKLFNFARGFESNRSVQLQVDYLLFQQKSVAIGYCANQVYETDPMSSKDVRIFPRILRAASSNCGAHYSVLVGSRNYNNSCQYLLRNSHGVKYWADSSIQCYCEDQISKERKDCSKADVIGNSNLKVLACWIGADKMLNNTYDVSYFN